MKYAVALVGLLGVYGLAYTFFGARDLYPRWRRWAVGLASVAAIATCLIVRPTFPSKPDNSVDPGPCWDGRSNAC